MTHISGVSYGDECWKVMKQWVENEDVDPIVTPRYDPPQRIIGTAFDPMRNDIIYEIRSACHHYSLLRAPSFAVAPVLPRPLPAPPIHFFFHHSKIALIRLPEAMFNTPPTYPILSSLLPGHYICHLLVQYANSNFEMVVHKPWG
jgi:hypothetical protein